LANFANDIAWVLYIDLVIGFSNKAVAGAFPGGHGLLLCV
jgi:hypothetical protein